MEIKARDAARLLRAVIGLDAAERHCIQKSIFEHPSCSLAADRRHQSSALPAIYPMWQTDVKQGSGCGSRSPAGCSE
jgi:hypothetical protein